MNEGLEGGTEVGGRYRGEERGTGLGGGRYGVGRREVQERWNVVNMYCVHSGSCLKTN